MSQPTKVLIIRFSSIGDIVLTTPVVRMLNEQLDGEVEIHYLVKEKFSEVLLANPYISKVHTIRKDLSEVMDTLKEVEFDYVIDLHRNIRSALVKKQLKSLSFTVDKLNFKKWMYVNWGLNRMPDLHIVDRYLETLKAFGIKNDQKGLDYFLRDQDRVDIHRDLPEKFSDGYFAFAIGAAHIGKKMPAGKIAEIITQLQHPILLLGGKDDSGEAEKIIDLSKGCEVYNACGRFSINQSASLVEQCEVLITGDTGLMHIGAAFKKKIVSLWGCTVPEFGMYPYLPHPESKILEPLELKKRPCSKLGNHCKYGTENRCITQIPSSLISDSANELFLTETKL